MEWIIFGPVGMIDTEKGIGIGTKTITSIIQTGTKVKRLGGITYNFRRVWKKEPYKYFKYIK